MKLAERSIMQDGITPSERVYPRRTFLDFFGEITLRYKYRIACWEIEKQAEHQAAWRWVQLQCEDKLRALGVDPNAQPEDLTKMLELWLVVGIMLGLIVCVGLFSIYRDALVQLVQRAM